MRPTYCRRNHSAWKSFRSDCTHTITHMYTCRYMHTCTLTHTHALIHICMRVLTPPHKQTHTNKHTQTHARERGYTQTYFHKTRQQSMHVHTRLYTHINRGRPATSPLLALAPSPQAHILSIPLEQYVIGAAAAQANAHARTRSGRQESTCSLGRECVPLARFGEI